jgi:ABC-2 type transport system permease protein
MSHLAASARREIRRLRQRPWDLAMITWVPALAVALVWWIFSTGLPRHLPIGVIDDDHSALSRQLVRMLDAVPGLQVERRFSGTREAESGLRSVEVYAVLAIPPDFERDIKRGQVGNLTLLHNAQFATHSGLIQRDVRATVATLSAGVEMTARNKRGESAQAVRVSAMPIQTRLVGLFNLSGDYQPFLGMALIPAVLHILAMTAGAWGVGCELRDRTLGEWLGSGSRGQTAAALAGKLLVPWVSLGATGAVALVAVTVGGGWYPAGSLAWVMVALSLLIAVSLAAGALLAGLTRSLQTALSGTGFFSAPAFAFSGVGFPLAAMSPFARRWAEAMPYTHYIQLQVGQLLMGVPVRLSVPTVVGLAAASVALWVVASLALHRAAGQPQTWGRD